MRVRFGSTQPAGTVVHVVLADGDVIASVVSTKDFSSVVASCPEPVAGQSYSVYTGGSATGTTLGGCAADGDLSGATDLGSVTANPPCRTSRASRNGRGPPRRP